MENKTTAGEPNIPKLFTPVQLGALSFTHRVAHAPMTRMRSDHNDAPTQMMVDYYGQRASSGGLMIAEATNVSLDARGYLGAPSIYDDSQIEGWKQVTNAVHEKGGIIVLQLFHAGRQSNIAITGGVKPGTASEVPTFDAMSFTQKGWESVSPARSLTISEIREVVENFRAAAVRAKAAGIDGVELHAANGYLPDQFLQDNSNLRTDEYGGSVENRARFTLELTEALISVYGADRVGVRISPSGHWGSMDDSNPEKTFGYLAEQLNKYNLAYLHIIEPRIKGDDTFIENGEAVAAAQIRKIYNGKIIAAGGFDRAGAISIIEKGDADVVAFGRAYSSNPDLPERLQHDLPLTPYVRDAFWGGNESNYSDFPTYENQKSTIE